VLFFFFQAEDGIRDFHVTGVQTCALPISRFAAEPGSTKKPPGRTTETADTRKEEARCRAVRRGSRASWQKRYPCTRRPRYPLAASRRQGVSVWDGPPGAVPWPVRRVPGEPTGGGRPPHPLFFDFPQGAQ